MQDTEKQKVFIKNVKVYKYDSLKTDSTLVWQADSSSQLFLKDEIPAFHPGEQIRVEAEIENISDSNYSPQNFVFLHHSIAKRDLMEEVSSRIYAKEYTIGEGLGLRFAAVDVLNSECLQDQSQDNYNSMAWGIPYRVSRLNETQDSTEIMALLGDSEHFHPRNGINDDNMPIYNMPILELQSPIWWRKYKEPTANINIVIDKKLDSTVQATATVDVTWSLNGELIILTKGNSTKKNPIYWTKTKKEISEEAIRRAEFVKVNNIWRMVKFSPMEIGLSDISKKSIVIQKISVLRNYDTIWKIVSPDQYLERESTLKLIKGEKVKIIIEAQNENNFPILVYLHYGAGQRRLLFKNEAGGIYSLEVDVDTISGLHSLIFDAIETNSINDKDAPYNAAMWKMPLMVTIK
ncbi:MAG: hypothetical protein HY934_03230 [Candidatus Firestonebacteria bacterium]|nr:hypothetical protein [Candidatus Firestonebacteria bacterium]